jgi:16S rRNA (cytosine967-C5)-methyltransferase
LKASGGDGELSPARAIAARVLERVYRDEAFASAALDAELRRRPQLDPRDRALATELVYGVLRTEGALAARIAAFAPRKGWANDPRVRAHVLMGAYALAFLDRVPAFAAVSEATAGARAAAGPRVGGFANALLRRLADAPRDLSLEDAVVASAAGWLRGALRKSLGRAAASAYLAAGPVPPPIGLAVRAAADRDLWIDRLRAAAPAAEIGPGSASPHAILVRGAGHLDDLPGANAAWIVQEEGAQVVALAVAARAGERVLDACAGRGNKAWLLGAAVGPSGVLDAADLYPAKLDALHRGPAGPAVRATHAVDWAVGVGDVEPDFDRVLVDAPCSGVGTLRRRPEIAAKRTPESITELAALQLDITRSAASRVKLGGRVVYAVCSVLAEESEAIVERLLEPTPDLALELAPLDAPPALAILAPGASTLRLLPHVHGTDGYFVASLVRAR